MKLVITALAWILLGCGGDDKPSGGKRTCVGFGASDDGEELTRAELQAERAVDVGRLVLRIEGLACPREAPAERVGVRLQTAPAKAPAERASTVRFVSCASPVVTLDDLAVGETYLLALTAFGEGGRPASGELTHAQDGERHERTVLLR